MKFLFPLLLCAYLLTGCASDSEKSVSTPTPTKKSVNVGATATAEAWDHPITATPLPSPTRILSAAERDGLPIVTRLSESNRRFIFHEIVDAEDKAERDANAQIPNPPGSDLETAERNLDLYNKLIDRYDAKVYKRFHVSKKEGKMIGNEGVDNHWPPLDP